MNRQNTPAVVMDYPRYKAMVQGMESNIADICASPKFKERLVKLMLALGLKKSKLLECSRNSMLNFLIVCAELQLDPGTHIHPVPFKGEITPILDYRGVVELAYRSGVVKSFNVQEVYAKDVYEPRFGTENTIRHEPHLGPDRGEITHVYAVVKMDTGENLVRHMTTEDINKIKARARAAGDGPWVTDWREMAKKTVVKNVGKLVPRAPELQAAIVMDGESEIGPDIKAQSLDALPTGRTKFGQFQKPAEIESQPVETMDFVEAAAEPMEAETVPDTMFGKDEPTKKPRQFPDGTLDI